MQYPIIYNNEIFKDINIEGIRPIYAVSNYGKVMNKETGKFLSINCTEDGYGRTTLYTIDGKTKHFLIHRLVLMTFNEIPNPSDFEVNHIYGEKLDNYVENIEWVTSMENNHHAFRTGLNTNIRQNHSKAKLTDKQVERICQLLSEGFDHKQIASMIGETSCKDIDREIRSIRDRKAWNSISCKYKFPGYDNLRDKFNSQQVHMICKLLELEVGYIDILNRVGINASELSRHELENYCDIISNIRCGRYYKDISSLYNFDNKTKARYDQLFNNDEVKTICSMLEVGCDYESILNSFNITKENTSYKKYDAYKHFISRIKCRKRFTEISKNYKF